MNEIKSRYIEIIFDKKEPQNVDTSINIEVKAENINEELEYKFLIGKEGIWSVIKEFSKSNQCIWVPIEDGNYIVMVQAREKSKARPLDYLAKEEFSIFKEEVSCPMKEEFRDNNDDKNKIVEDSSIEFTEIMNRNNDNVLFLKALPIIAEEKKILMKEIDKNIDEIEITQEIVAVKEVKDKKDIQNIECNDSKKYNCNDLVSKLSKKLSDNYINSMDEGYNDIIEDITVEKHNIVVGEKAIIIVNPIDKDSYLYKFYIKSNDDWAIIREYDTDNTLTYTTTESGRLEFLIQCKKLESTGNFDDFRIIDIDVEEKEKIEIVNIKCLSSELICGEELEFTVETNIKKNNQQVILYKFYKILKDGKSSCIQDYSTNNHVKFVENYSGTYRILCLARDILSNKEYDDRAIIIYNIKPYKDIKINDFKASLNSPQATETEISFNSDVEGGNDLLYRYKVKGPIEIDTGFTVNKEFLWNPNEPGEYEVFLYVKDRMFNGEYEDSGKIMFTIEKRGKKKIKILDVIVDKEKKIIIGDTVNIMVHAEGGTGLLYSFTIKTDGKVIEEYTYSKSNWIDFIPNKSGEYEVEIKVKDKYSEKDFDINTLIYFKAMKYIPGEIDYILLPYKENYLIGDKIEFECISENTNEILIKYETKINGQIIGKTEFSKDMKLTFTPKTPGKYTIEAYAKNVKCEKEFDSKKQINLYVSEASPVLNTKIISNKIEGKVNEEFSIKAISRGGKDVCYEFYLMENYQWKKVQSYSKKNFYSFIPFTSGDYKILALAKSYHKKVSYEDYSELDFRVKD